MSGVGDAVNLGLSALGGSELMNVSRGVLNGAKSMVAKSENYFKSRLDQRTNIHRLESVARLHKNQPQMQILLCLSSR